MLCTGTGLSGIPQAVRREKALACSGGEVPHESSTALCSVAVEQGPFSVPNLMPQTLVLNLERRGGDLIWPSEPEQHGRATVHSKTAQRVTSL